MKSPADKIREGIEASVAVKRELLAQVASITQVGELLVRAYAQGRKALFFGNGGSAADAQHLAAELVGRYLVDRPALPALALTVNSSLVTAVANDYGYEEVFARQLEGLGVAGDVAVGLSTSGNSENVVRGLARARAKGLVTVGLTGADGGRVATTAEHCIKVPSRETARIQEAHILVGHLWCELIEASLPR